MVLLAVFVAIVLAVFVTLTTLTPLLAPPYLPLSVPPAQEVEFDQSGCMVDVMPEERVEWNKTNLVVYITTTGCDVQFSVRKEGNRYIISEISGNQYCKCLCTKRVVIYNASKGSEIVFVSRKGERVIL